MSVNDGSSAAPQGQVKDLACFCVAPLAVVEQFRQPRGLDPRICVPCPWLVVRAVEEKVAEEARHLG